MFEDGDIWILVSTSCFFFCMGKDKVWYWSSCFCTHSAPQWSHLGWGKWWPHPWRSGAPPSPEAWRRPSEGRWAFVRGHVQLRTTLGEGAHTEKIQKWTCRVDTLARLSERLFNDSHEEHFFSTSSPLMTSCLLVSFFPRRPSASGGAISLQLGGSASNSSRRGSISSSWGEGLVGEGPGPSEPETAPSKLRSKSETLN